jgi:indole-3-glycerol phosphate synthase
VSEQGSHRLSQAVAEGDAISLLVEVPDTQTASAMEEQGADGVVVRTPLPSVREATELPILWCADGPDAASAAGADGCLLIARSYGEDWDRLADDHARVLELGLDVVVEVRDEEELEETLERVDPEIVLLAGNGDPDVDVLDHVLELLPDVPAGKLAVAHVAAASRDDVVALERAGIDAVVVETRDVRALVGDEPPEV